MSRLTFAPFDQMMQNATRRRSLIFSLLLVGALLAFEVFNYSTTDFAMTDLLGDLRFAGVRWSTILALAFCGIDFAGIARLFTPEQGKDEPAEVWYLFGAWVLAAAMNALLTWWGVSIAILSHDSLGNAVISREALLKGVPVFVAIMVWLSRIMIIGTFSVAGERLFGDVTSSRRRSAPKRRSRTASRPPVRRSPPAARRPVSRSVSQPSYRPANRSASAARRSTYSSQRPNFSTSYRPAPKPNEVEQKSMFNPPMPDEPTYEDIP